MSSPTIRITGIDSTIARVKRVGDTSMLGASLMKGGVYLRGVLATYPPAKHLTRRSVYGRPFQTDRQRRWFFAALREGRLKIPYVRTRTLGHRWAVKKVNDFLVHVGNNTPYARYVMDADKPQSKFMAAIGWQTVQQIARKEKANVIRIVREDLLARLRRV